MTEMRAGCSDSPYPVGVRWLRDASAGEFNSHSVASGVLGLLVISLVRLLSERPFGRLRKGSRMTNPKHKKMKKSNDPQGSRKFHHYVLETMWAVAASGAAGRWLP